MIRYICREDDIGATANIGGPVQTTYKTFTDATEVEDWLTEKIQSSLRTIVRTIIACEVVAALDGGKEGGGEH